MVFVCCVVFPESPQVPILDTGHHPCARSEVVSSLIEEYKAAESPDYVSWGMGGGGGGGGSTSAAGSSSTAGGR